MSPKQENYYWSLWGKVKVSLAKRGIPPKEAEVQRHVLHAKALGADKSHRSFSNSDFDKVIAAFRAEFDDSNMFGQLRQQAMPRQRLMHLVGELLTVLDQDRDYLEGIIRRMNHEGKLGAAEIQLEELTEDQVQTKLIPALKKSCRRLWPSKDHLLDAVRTYSTDLDLDETTAKKAACKALKCTNLPPLTKLTYDQLLTIWAAFRNLPRGERSTAGEVTADIPF